jgi:hypothetical protein
MGGVNMPLPRMLICKRAMPHFAVVLYFFRSLPLSKITMTAQAGVMRPVRRWA